MAASSYGNIIYDGSRPLAFGPTDDTINQNWIFGSWHPGICHFVMADASVQKISVDIDINVYGRLGHKDDGFPVGLESN